MKKVSVVVPVYHSAASLPELLDRLEAVAERHPEAFEFLFVDDGSRDDSFRVLEELARKDRRVRALKLTRNFGSTAAASAGVQAAKGDVLIALSADLQDPPELIDQMLEHWRQGARIVLAARSTRRDPWLTSATSQLFWRLFRRWALPSMPLHGCDYCLFDRVVLNALADTHEPPAGIGMLLWTGYEPVVIEYERRARAARFGRSRWTWSGRWRYFIDSFVSFSHFPVRAASVLGMLLGLVGVVYAVLIVYSRLAHERASDGWASLMVVLLVVSGTQLLMIGILGEYLVRTLEATRRRPAFVIERAIDGSETELETTSARESGR